jgi:tetratricopeptide (TPR) repeat protein
VYDRAAMPDREVRELYLRLCMLSTLLHELAHHVDKTTRVARGRWLCIPGDKAEEFATQNEYAWTQQYAAPYLQRRYPEAVRAFEDWIAHYGGVRISFAQVAETARPFVLNVGGAYEWLAEAVARGESLQATRLGFAEELRFADRYDEALQSVELVLAEHPGDTAALTAKALILEHLDRYDEAEQAANAALANDADCLDAWDVLTDVYRATGRWDRLELAATQVLLLDSTWWQKHFALADRAAARIELGEFAAAQLDIDELSRQRGKWSPRWAAVLRVVLLLRQCQHEAALASATELVQSANRILGVELELLATRLEASHALGTLKPDQRLSDDDLARLRRRGYSDWAQRIVAIQQVIPATRRPKRR